MPGRLDYKKRKQKRIENYEARAEKASVQAEARTKRANEIVHAINGQPLLIGHYSEKRHKSDLKKIDNNFRKANELEQKSNYYQSKAESVRKNNAISSDDPEAITKLERQLAALEKLKEDVKKQEHTSYELNYISADIRRTKARIEELKELENIDFKTITLKDGKIIHNKEKNRIQILFDIKPEYEIRKSLKSNGFKWAGNDGAWQRLFNKNSILAVNRLTTSGVLEVVKDEKMS